MVVNGREINNQWIVLYNRDLCGKYNAHINVQRVAVHSVVKYLYKYLHKEYDRATITLKSGTTHDDNEQTGLHRQRNEMQEYLNC